MATRKYKHRSIDIWNEEETPVLEGVVLAFEQMKVDKDERDTMSIDTLDGIYRVWHSSALDEAFSLAGVGDGIRLVYRGKVALSGGKTYKRISVAVWEKGSLEEIAAEQEKAKRPVEASHGDGG